MHIDLNSCFATVEQQANPLLRGIPIAVAAYAGLSGCVISPSIEAKKFGIKVGMRVKEAKYLLEDLIILPPDPPKYRAIHKLFRELFKTYSPYVVPKSIDEAVIDFTNTIAIKRGLYVVAKEIKTRMKQEIGEWISCSIGISTNRFLAKTAASLHKPDGLDIITHKNLIAVYKNLQLTDLNGINRRFEARLMANGIRTPIDFLNATAEMLKKEVFKSICGYDWYARLRGFEVDDVSFERKSFGQSYALHKFTDEIEELSRILMKLCEKMGRRLRKALFYAYGIHISCSYIDGTFWHKAEKSQTKLYTTLEFFQKARTLLKKQPEKKKITHLAVSCYDLNLISTFQLELFDQKRKKAWNTTSAVDHINNRYGEFTIIPALIMRMDDEVIDRVTFGNVQELYE